MRSRARFKQSRIFEAREIWICVCVYQRTREHAFNVIYERVHACAFVCETSSSPRTLVLIKGTSKLKVMICRNILVLALLSHCPTREMEPLQYLMPHLLAVRNPACSRRACLQRFIYIKRKDILSSGFTHTDKIIQIETRESVTFLFLSSSLTSENNKKHGNVHVD